MYKLKTFSLIAGLALSLAAGVAVAGSDTGTMGTMTAMKNMPKTEGILLPFMSPSKGRKLFASKGCVVCHSINGIGGEDAPALDASTMQGAMNPFDFAAKMWRGAGTMIAMQEDELGEQIEFTGAELANIIAFVHSADEQKKFTRADIPPRIAKLMGHITNESEEHEKKEHN